VVSVSPPVMLITEGDGSKHVGGGVRNRKYKSVLVINRKPLVTVH